MTHYCIEQRDTLEKPYFTWQGLTCHPEGGCSTDYSWDACVMALATKMVRRGVPDGMMCMRHYDFESVYRLEEYERSPKLWTISDVKLTQKWIKEYGEKGITVRYAAQKMRWSFGGQRRYYVSFADQGARFAFYVIWRNKETPYIQWPNDWQLDMVA